MKEGVDQVITWYPVDDAPERPDEYLVRTKWGDIDLNYYDGKRWVHFDGDDHEIGSIAWWTEVYIPDAMFADLLEEQIHWGL